MPTHGERHVIELNLNFCILAIELNSRSVFYFCMSATKCGKFKDTHSFHLVCQRMACELNPKADAPHSRIRKKGKKKSKTYRTESSDLMDGDRRLGILVFWDFALKFPSNSCVDCKQKRIFLVLIRQIARVRGCNGPRVVGQ